jgi:uncharacterized protein YlzI (FlbEa/FlbD family)
LSWSQKIKFYSKNQNSFLTESAIDSEIKDCEDVIKKLASGKFKNESDEVIEHIKKCKHVFSITQDSNGQYTIIIKDSALRNVEKAYPELVGKFKSAADCKKDVAKCRKDKL